MTNTKILSDENNVTSTLLNGPDMHHFKICLLILTISSDDSIYNTAFSPFISSYQYELLFCLHFKNIVFAKHLYIFV